MEIAAPMTPPPSHATNERTTPGAPAAAAAVVQNSSLSATSPPPASIRDVQDELTTLSLVASTLIASLGYYVKGAADVAAVKAEGADVVSPLEAANFVAVAADILASRPDALQQLLFDAPFEFFEIFSSIIVAKKRFLPPPRPGETPCGPAEVQDAFAALRRAAIRASKELVALCSACGAAALSLCCSAVMRAGVGDVVLTALTTAATDDATREAAAEALFVFVMKLGCEAIPHRAIEDLLALAPIEPNTCVRRYAVALLREVAELRPGVLAHGKSALLRLAAVDSDPDIRTLAIDAVGCSLRYGIAQFRLAANPASPSWHGGSFPAVAAASQSAAERQALLDTAAAVADVVALRFEASSEVDDVAEALCRAFEVCLHVSCELRDPASFAFALRHSLHSHFVRCLERPPEVAAAAARALRILLERAPPHLSVASRLVVGSTLASVLRALMELSAGPLNEAPLAQRIVCVELATMLGIVLVHSPANRAKFARELDAFPMWARSLSSRVQECFAAAAVDYFEGMVVQDVNGVVLNDVEAVDWVVPSADAGAPHPTKVSLQSIFDAQEMRRQVAEGGAAGLAAWLECERLRHPRDSTATASNDRRGYLAMVLLGFACLSTLSRAHSARTQAADATRATGGIRSPEMHRAAAAAAAGGGGGGGGAFATPRAPSDAFVRDASPWGDASHPALQQLSAIHRTGQPPEWRLPAQQVDEDVAAQSLAQPTGEAPWVPMFPTRRMQPSRQVRQAGEGGGDDHEAGGPPEAYMLLRAEFQACMKLAIEFSEFYINKRQGSAPHSSVPGAKPGTFARSASSSGLVMRVSRVPKLTNPFAPVKIDKNHLRAWSVASVNEGDLLFFSIPLQALTSAVLDAVVGKARRHALSIKKAFLTTPQTMRERRWFLHDMQSAIMPRIITHLKAVEKTLQLQGDQPVQVALSLLPSIRDANGQKVLYSGNLVHVVKFLQQQYGKGAPGAHSPHSPHHQGGSPDAELTRHPNERVAPRAAGVGGVAQPSNASFGGGVSASFHGGLLGPSRRSFALPSGAVVATGGAPPASSPRKRVADGGSVARPLSPLSKVAHSPHEVVVSPRSDVSSGPEDLEDRF